MSLRINNNIDALNAHRNLQVTSSMLAKSMEKLSSGLRINRAADDAAGLAISEKMRGQINGLQMASKNAQDGISLIQTAEGALNETHSILQRMRELTIQASNGTLEGADKDAIQLEIDELVSELTGIATRTEFNGMTLLDGTYATTGITLQIGANSGQTMEITIGNMTAAASGLNVSSVDLGSGGDPVAALGLIDSAISTVSDTRAQLGAFQNRLEHTINNLNVAAENLTAAESRIRDLDMASEMVDFTRSQILQQAGTAMLAQANSAPQSVLQLLR